MLNAINSSVSSASDERNSQVEAKKWVDFHFPVRDVAPTLQLRRAAPAPARSQGCRV